MKTCLLSSLLCAAFFPALARAADDLPRPQTFARYEPMMKRSPFAVATAVVPPPQAPNFAKDLFIANAAKLIDEGVVTINSSTDKSLKEYLSTKGPNEHGYSISNIEWSDRVGATKVTITKDGQFATLTFNQALISQPVVSAIQQQQPVVNIPPQIPQPVAIPPPAVGMPAPNGRNALRPAPIPMLPTPPPRVRGVIQRNATGGVSPIPVPPAPIQDQ